MSVKAGEPPTAEASGRAGNGTSAGMGRVAALGLLALVVLIWGANWPIMKVAVEQMPPLRFAAIRLALGCAVLFILTGSRGLLRFPDRRDWPVVIGVGLLPMAAFVTLITVGIQFVAAGRSAILSYTTPLWVVPLAIVFLRERMDRWRLAGMACGLAGVAVLFNPAALDWGDHRALFGNGLLLLAAFLWAINIVQVRAHQWVGTPLTLAPWQTLLATLIMVPLAFMLDSGQETVWSLPLVLALLYNGVLASAFCFWAMVTVNRALPAITLSLSTLATPVVGLLLSAWWLGEVLTVSILTGLGCIGFGLILVGLGERRANP